MSLLNGFVCVSTSIHLSNVGIPGTVCLIKSRWNVRSFVRSLAPVGGGGGGGGGFF